MPCICLARKACILGRPILNDIFRACYRITVQEEPKRVPEFVAALKACANQEQLSLERGMALHKQIKKCGLDSNVVVATTLVDMYSKCGSMQRAKDVFDGIASRNVVTWTCLIMGYVENGESSKAMEMFISMDCQPNAVTYVAILKACVGLAAQAFSLEKGMAIHKELKERGYDRDVVVSTTLVDMYSKCRSMYRAREVFDQMIRRNVVTWNCLIMGYVENGESSTALDLFMRIDCEPNSVTYVAALKACTCLAASRRSFSLEKGMLIHKRVKERGLGNDIVVGTALVDMYSKCGDIQLAREVFDRMVSWNVISWTCLISGYVENGLSSVAIDLFRSIDCEPDSVTYVAALKACASSGREKLEQGIAIHEQVRKLGYDSHISVANTLVDMYSKCGSIQRAKEVFDLMRYRDIFTWTSLILGYVENGQGSVALDLFMSMNCEPDSSTYTATLRACGSLTALLAGRGIHSQVCKLGLEEDEGVCTALVDFYGKCGNMSVAEWLFNSVQCPGIYSWTALISSYSSLGDISYAFNLVEKIQECGLYMDSITYTCILTACNHAGMVDEGRKFLDSMCKYGVEPNLEHFNCMVDMLGRANRIQEALNMVRNMPFEANNVTWLALLGACRKWKNLEVGRVAFDALVARNSRDGAAYVMMCDIYENFNMWGDQEQKVEKT